MDGTTNGTTNDTVGDDWNPWDPELYPDGWGITPGTLQSSHGCFKCKKNGADITLKKCAKCQSTPYCSRACQRADWKVHKKDCAQLAGALATMNAAVDMATGPPPARPPQQRITYMYKPEPCPPLRSPPQGLEKSISRPFSKLLKGKYLHNRPEGDVIRILLECHRLRNGDMYNVEGMTQRDSIYGRNTNPMICFRYFLIKLGRTEGLLPKWWTFDHGRQAMALGSEDGWYDLRKPVDKEALVEHYGDTGFPLQLRMLAEAIFRAGVGGESGAEMMKTLAKAEPKPIRKPGGRPPRDDVAAKGKECGRCENERVGES